MIGGDDDAFPEPEQEDVIPGDNDKLGPPQKPTPTGIINPDAPDNLTRIPADPNGNVPIVAEPKP